MPGEFVVKLKSSFGSHSKSRPNPLPGQVKSLYKKRNLAVIKRPQVELKAYSIQALKAHPDIEIVEPNYIYRANSLPSDPNFSEQWGLLNAGGTNSKTGLDIAAEAAWSLTTGTRDVVVAVIDTGVDYNNPDIAPNTWINDKERDGAAGVDDDGNGYIDDVHGINTSIAPDYTADPMGGRGHGSNCAGIIGAKGNDSIGMTGIAWDVQIMPVKFLSDDGSGSLHSAVMAVDYAVNNGAKIINASFGCMGCESELLKEAIERANEAGVLFVAASGNNSTNIDYTAYYPAGYDLPNVITVGSIKRDGTMATTSNFGPKRVHLAAPGVQIFSVHLNGFYSWSGGTSMAAPFVSGVAALLLAKEPNLRPFEIKDRLLRTARPLASLRGNVTSSGFVNAYHALTNTLAPNDPDDPANWSYKELGLSSPHPYVPKELVAFDVEVENARELVLVFSKIEVARAADRVKLKDRDGNRIALLPINAEGHYTAVIPGNFARVEMNPQSTHLGYGFDLIGVHYR